MIAAERGDDALMTLLLAHGADAKATDREQRTALFYAAWANHSDAVATLQHAGAILEARDSRGYNALDAATAVGAEQSAQQLRDFGLRGNKVAGGPQGRQNGKFDAAHPGDIYKGWPALALAVSRNDSASVQQLLASGGRPPDARAAGGYAAAGCSRCACGG